MIAVNTGDKFDQWYTDNLKYMIDNYSNLNYDKFEVIDEEIYEGVFDKLQMFNKFRDGQNIFFDLDILIKGDCNKFLKKKINSMSCLVEKSLEHSSKLIHNILVWRLFSYI